MTTVSLLVVTTNMKKKMQPYFCFFDLETTRLLNTNPDIYEKVIKSYYIENMSAGKNNSNEFTL
jgi:hypothetical protein